MNLPPMAGLQLLLEVLVLLDHRLARVQLQGDRQLLRELPADVRVLDERAVALQPLRRALRPSQAQASQAESARPGSSQFGVPQTRGGSNKVLFVWRAEKP
jgi:hypothetical protein